MARSTVLGTFGNLFWILFGGWFSAFGYLFGGLVFCATIIGIPAGLQLFKLALYAFLPFDRQISDGGSSVSALFNVAWILFFGLWIALSHIAAAFLCAITIVFLPLASAHLRLAGLALAPFGKRVS